jgi:hypothetical protein
MGHAQEYVEALQQACRAGAVYMQATGRHKQRLAALPSEHSNKHLRTKHGRNEQRTTPPVFAASPAA